MIKRTRAKIDGAGAGAGAGARASGSSLDDLLDLAESVALERGVELKN